MALRNQEIGGRLRELRGEKPQTTVALELGVGERTYQTWEAGDAKPSYRNLQRLADYFGVPEEFILTGTAPSPVDTPDPFTQAQPAGPVEVRLDAVQGDLATILAAMTAQLTAQTEVLTEVRDVLHDVKALLGRDTQVIDRLETVLGHDKTARADMDDSARRLLAAADDASRVLRGASQRPASKREPQAK